MTSALAKGAMTGAAAILLALALTLGVTPATADAPGLSVRLDQANTLPGQCQLVFVVENRTGAALEQVQVETVLLSRQTRVLQLRLLDFQALPAGSLRVRSFNLPGLDCADVGRVLFNAIAQCAPLGAAACTKALRVSSDTAIEVLK